MNESEYRRKGVLEHVSHLRTVLTELVTSNPASSQFLEVQSKVEYLFWILDQSDPNLFSLNDIGFIESQLSNISNHLVPSGEGFNNYSNLSMYFSNIFEKYPYPRIRKIFRSEINEKIEEFRAQVSMLQEGLYHVERRLDAIGEGKIAELEERLDEARVRLRTLPKEIDVTIDELTAKSRNSFEGVVNEARNDFSESLRALREEHQKKSNEIIQTTQRYSSKFDELNKSVNEEIKRAEKSAAEALMDARKEADTVVSKIKDLYSIAGQTALAGGFSAAAKEERTIFDNNSFWAKWIFLVSALILGAVWLWTVFHDQDYDAKAIFWKLPATFALLVPGTYFASIASKARRNSMRLQSLGLRISAFEAYLQGLDGAQANGLRNEMAKCFFEGVDDQSDVKNASILSAPKETLNFMEKLLDKIPDFKS